MEHYVDSVFRQLHTMSPLLAWLAIAGGMMLESMCIPIPSELVLPLAGYFAAQGKFGSGPPGFIAALLAVTLGSLLGSSIAYAIGYYGGAPLVERFGRYILVTPHRLQTAGKWIERFGPGAVVFGRLVFAVRAVISYPVGVLRMGYRRFILFTFIGCTIWNLVAVTLGYYYGERVHQYLHRMSLGMFAVLALVLLILGGFYFWKTHLAHPVDKSPAPQIKE